ncbi:MAG: DUF4197 domain-containing protein [Flavipsychrobacter sp.]
MKQIVKALLLTGFVAGSTTAANAQTLKDWVNKANTVVNGGSGNNSTTGGNNNGGIGSNLSNNEIVSALRQALEIGTKNASGRLNVTNGFFGNQIIKVLMPPEARQIETTLRSLGMGAQVDKAILSMNRAAEDASGKAVPIFVNAITGMSIQDGLSILQGGQGAATNFLKNRTTVALTSEFRPVIQNSLNKVGATRYWADIVNIYNRLPTVRNKVNPDLAGYVTERALNGLFVTIADEENKIRLDPASRVTDLLKKVFGSK